MSKTKNNALRYFWLPSDYTRTCVSGVNQYTIEYKSKSHREFDANMNFQKHILPSLRSQAEPYPKNLKYLPKSEYYPSGFRCVVNDALKEIYSNRKGFVFNKEQLIEILRFMPNAKVLYSSEMYFVWK